MVNKPMKWQAISVKHFFSTAKVAVYHVALVTMIFSHVKISYFRAKAHLVFHCWLLITDLRRKEEILILRKGRLNFRKIIRS